MYMIESANPAVARSWVYAALSRAFRSPGDDSSARRAHGEFLRQLRQGLLGVAGGFSLRRDVEQLGRLLAEETSPGADGLRDDYRSCFRGIEPELPAITFESLCLLAYREAVAVAKGDRERATACREARGRFLEEHLCRWLSPLAGSLEQAGVEGFYPALVLLTRRWVELEQATLGDCRGPGSMVS